MPPSIKPSIEGDIVRGTKVAFTIQDPPQDMSVKSWKFEETLETSKKVKPVTRPKNDSAQTWDISWEGQMLTSGKIIVKYEIKKKVSKGKYEVKKGTLEHEVKVVARTGDAWLSTIINHDDLPTSTIPNNSPGGKPKIPPQSFSDLGAHYPRREPPNYIPKTINPTRGPNRGYSIFDVLQFEFHSDGYINDHLRDAESQFSKAQDGNAYFTMGKSTTLHLVKSPKYYLLSGKNVKINNLEEFYKDHDIPVNITSPPPIRPIDKKDWTMSGSDVKLVISEDDFRKKYNIGDKACKYLSESYKIKPPRILHENLLKNTRRHEYAGNPNSHRANYEKLVRALDPKAYAESLISRPGTQVNLTVLLKNRLRLVDMADVKKKDLHGIVDEQATKNEKQVKFVASERIYDCNEKDNGNFDGIVWNIVNNRPFPESQ